MLTIPGQTNRFCDGVSRRNFLKVGALGLGLTLPQLLKAEAQSGIRKSHKAVIMVYLPGGPPQQDMLDIKEDAPAEVRGEFKSIATNVPGIRISELMPNVARVADKIAFIRSISDGADDHTDFMCMTRRRRSSAQPLGGWPTMGATVSKLLGNANPAVPAFIGLEPRMDHRPYNAANHGFLGVSHNSFRPSGEGKSDMVLNGITTDRLGDRQALLTSFDNFRRDVDNTGLMAGLDKFNQQAFGVLTSSKLLEALDATRENPKLIERYGQGSATVRGEAAPMLNQQFLIARRLVEAGARFVTVAYGYWDFHVNTAHYCRMNLPPLDQGLAALVNDLHERGLDKDVSVIVWGEFGRAPTINKDGGRDHWPRISCAMLAGGGMKTGHVIGATDRLGGEAAERPVAFGEVFATLYHNLGIDVNKATVEDLTGRPHFLVDNGHQPMKELVG